MKRSAALVLAGCLFARVEGLQGSLSQEPEPYRKVFSASKKIASDPNAPEFREAETFGPLSNPGIGEQEYKKKVGVVPWDMMIGAKILYGLSQKNTPEPPPNQKFVTQQMVSSCPMLMFGISLSIRPPRCGNSMGSWYNEMNNQTILRWGASEQGGAGLYFGVDSAITGDASVKFADMNQRYSTKDYWFDFKNCFALTRYSIKEEIMQTDSETVDGTKKKDAFYKYTIYRPDGTAVAESSVFKRDQVGINITTVEQDDTPPKVVATALREGDWKGNQWRECTSDAREWDVLFKESIGKSLTGVFDMDSTVQDLRVATAALITLMAYRDESTDANGLQSTGSGHAAWVVIRTIIIVLAVLAGAALLAFGAYWSKIDIKLRRFFFRLESGVFPQRASKTRFVTLPPSY